MRRVCIIFFSGSLTEVSNLQIYEAPHGISADLAIPVATAKFYMIYGRETAVPLPPS